MLVEAAIDGAEVECAVLEGLDGGSPEASVPGMIVVDPHATWYDFEAKYLAEESRMEIPAPIPSAAASRVRSLACAAFDAIDCEGLARVDFFYTPSGEVLVNEINTMPGMTPTSGFPLMWAASGCPCRSSSTGSLRPRWPSGAAPQATADLRRWARAGVRRRGLASGGAGVGRRGRASGGARQRTAATEIIPVPPCVTLRTARACLAITGDRLTRACVSRYFFLVLAAGLAVAAALPPPLTRALKSAPGRGTWAPTDAAT